MTPSSWTILLTHAQADWQVYCALLNRGIDCIMPHTLASARRGRWAQGVVRPLYPGYLFVRMDVSLDALRSTTGVREILRVGPKPVFLSEGEVVAYRAHARQLLDESRPQRAEISFVKPGDVIRVTQGPFLGAPAVVEAVEKNGMVRGTIGQVRVTFPLAVRGSAKPAEMIT